MTGQVLELREILTPDSLATRLTERYVTWDGLRNTKKVDWEEIRRYVYATDTTQTTNNQLPWKNKTTIPKICQIRDNLYSNYTATMFPKRKNVVWEPFSQDSNTGEKVAAITNYMTWVMSQPSFKHELDKIILDYIDFGNCFATVEWIDERVEQPDKTQTGYIGPAVRRISPLDMVMQPTSENFLNAPKFVRSLTSMGELKKMLEKMSTDENRPEYEALFNYLKNVRFRARQFSGDWIQRDHLYQMEGFTSFRAYLQSDMVEVLTFYGDYYDYDTDNFQQNRVITVVDRHKLIGNKPNPSFFGYPPIFHVPWRKRQDNLWGMGPLDNLVGMQYRLDHIENMRADVVDVITYPVQKVKGFVQDFTWQPGEKIFTSEEGDVELVAPDVNVLQAQFELGQLAALMEEMAGAPKEAMGFRTPGEKTKYEVQRLENAAARVFQNKIKQFEEQMVEPLLNAMLELARRNMPGSTIIKVMNNDLGVASFEELTVDDITGIGRIKPIAARHFAEQAELIQNMTNLTGSGLWPLVQPHFSGKKMAHIISSIFDLDDYEVVSDWASLAEQAEAQKMTNVLQEQVHSAAGTATGMGGDYDMNAAQPAPSSQPPFDLQRNPAPTATPKGTIGTV